MARFSSIARGTLARTPVTLTFGETRVMVDVRPLLVTEEIEALSLARAHARAKGLDQPKEGEPVYDLAVMAHVVTLAAIDHDSPADAPVPFFDSVDQALSLDRDRLHLLYESQTEWQQQCSPRQTTMTPEEYAGLVFALAGGSEGADPFFNRLPRALLVSCMRTMAAQLLSSPTPRSPSTSSTSPSGASEPPSGTDP